MDYSYDEILERMNNKFLELSGYEADRVSDIGIRIRLLAGEIFSLSSDIDWIKKQMFPNTASGEQLELHAQQRGLERKTGNKATGQIMFQVDTPLEYELVVPKGTICTTTDGSLNFITTEDATIIRGGNYVLVDSEAEKSGTQYNVSPNMITTIVTYFSVGISVKNSSSFIDGTDDETDDQLRERIMDSMENIPNGANSKYYISLAKTVDGVQSASIVQRDNQSIVEMYIAGRGEIPETLTVVEAQRVVTLGKSLGIQVHVMNASKVDIDVDVSISVESGYDFDTVKAAVEDNITEFFLDLDVGEGVTLSALGDVIFHTDGVANYSFNSMTDTTASKKELLCLSSVTVSEITSEI